ncbi:MAG: hypothetical protein II075_01810 [Bacteroidales bacterium]|nr:hypothetical protein [Bacteroidales bacterium]
MFLNLYNQPIKVFLADITPDMEAIRDELRVILHRAGMEIVDGPDVPPDMLKDVMQKSECSVHILGADDIFANNTDGKPSSAGQQYLAAKELCSDEFKMFVWNPSGSGNRSKYINKIRRDIEENVIYTDKSSAIVFVEDIRNIMTVKQAAIQETVASDIFFLYNDLDTDTARDICTMLSDIRSVTKLGISMSSEVDYNTYIRQQLAVSKIGVVYYNFAGDWAVSFARQIWKDNGGNSGATPLCIVGNSDHAKAEQLKIFAGLMECAIDDQLRIPLDINMFLDKNNQNQ